MTAPRVSVIVPCYNGGPFLDGLMATLDAQTFRDFETIIVDDGSTDPLTREKLNQLASTARVVHQKNLHLSAARNTGFRQARADLVLPLDCDDRLEPGFLAETVAALESAPPPVGFAFTHMRLTGELGGVLPRRVNRFDQLFLNQLPYCMLIRKSAWQKAGGYDETMRDGGEDWEFNIRLLTSGIDGVEVPKPLFLYAVRLDGMLLSHTTRMHGTIWRAIRERHADLYRIGSLVRLWRETRTGHAKISAVAAAALLLAKALLPETWFNELFYWVFGKTRARRIERGEIQAGTLPASGIAPHAKNSR